MKKIYAEQLEHEIKVVEESPRITQEKKEEIKRLKVKHEEQIKNVREEAEESVFANLFNYMKNLLSKMWHLFW